MRQATLGTRLLLSLMAAISLLLVVLTVETVWMHHINLVMCQDVTEAHVMLWHTIAQVGFICVAAVALLFALFRFMLRRAEVALRDSEQRHQTLIENLPVGVYRVAPGPEGELVMANSTMAEMFGFESVDRLLESDIRDLFADPDDRDQICEEIDAGGNLVSGEVRLKTETGTPLWASMTTRVIRDDHGKIKWFDGCVEDISDHKQMEDELRQAAFQDALSQLPNRALFYEWLDNAFKRRRRHADYSFSVFFLDLDRFKNINDSLGHAAGDKLLVETARRLQSCIRETGKVARLGGDEFAIFVDDIESVNDLVRIAERIHEALEKPFQFDGMELYTSASIGIAQTSPEYDRPDDLLRDADIAMYQAKARGKACFQMFNSEMHDRIKEVLELENGLRHAIERGEFRSYYQPIISLDSGRIVGLEVLLRWQHPQRGLLSPSDFLHVAEDTGLIVPIGWHLLRQSCQQVSDWQDQFPDTSSLTIGVNLSLKQMAQCNLVERVTQIIGESGIDAHRLNLEVTEDSVIGNTQHVADLLSTLKSTGTRLTIDDFGTGYSSLSCLHRYPFDTLKIDASFISGESSGGENWEVIKTIITLAHNLGMVAVAEGVETEEQRARLKLLRCDLAQGDFFSEPLDAESLYKLFARGAHGKSTAASASFGPSDTTLNSSMDVWTT